MIERIYSILHSQLPLTHLSFPVNKWHMSLSDTLSCPYLVCASSSSRVPGNFEVVLLLPFAIFIFPPVAAAAAAAAGWDFFCMSSNSHPPPPHVPPPNASIPLISLSPSYLYLLQPPSLCQGSPISRSVWGGVLQYLCAEVIVGNGAFVCSHFMSSSY